MRPGVQPVWVALRVPLILQQVLVSVALLQVLELHRPFLRVLELQEGHPAAFLEAFQVEHQVEHLVEEHPDLEDHLQQEHPLEARLEAHLEERRPLPCPALVPVEPVRVALPELGLEPPCSSAPGDSP